MTVTLPDSVKDFVEKQVGCGRYGSPDAFVAELVRTEAEMFERINRGEPIPFDEHFDRRLEVLLDEADRSGDYLEVDEKEFDAMEREALDLLRRRMTS